MKWQNIIGWFILGIIFLIGVYYGIRYLQAIIELIKNIPLP